MTDTALQYFKVKLYKKFSKRIKLHVILKRVWGNGISSATWLSCNLKMLTRKLLLPHDSQDDPAKSISANLCCYFTSLSQATHNDGLYLWPVMSMSIDMSAKLPASIATVEWKWE